MYYNGMNSIMRYDAANDGIYHDYDDDSVVIRTMCMHANFVCGGRLAVLQINVSSAHEDLIELRLRLPKMNERLFSAQAFE